MRVKDLRVENMRVNEPGLLALAAAKPAIPRAR